VRQQHVPGLTSQHREESAAGPREKVTTHDQQFNSQAVGRVVALFGLAAAAQAAAQNY